MQDQIELNSDFTNLENTEGDFLVGHKFPNMRSMDTKTNKFGRSLVEILTANSLICLSGIAKEDPLGNFTCFTPKGNSVVDCVILNDDLFDDVVYFTVNPLSYLSGHCFISFALKSGSFCCRYTNEDSFLKEKPNSFILDVSSKQKFSKIAGSDDIVTSAMKIINLHINSLNQNTQSKLNLGVNSVTKIIKDMASRCFKRRQKTSKCNKQSDKWFQKTLEEMKQEVLRTAKILNKHPNDRIIRGKYCTLKKKFKKGCERKRTKFKNKDFAANIFDGIQ